MSYKYQNPSSLHSPSDVRVDLERDRNKHNANIGTYTPGTNYRDDPGSFHYLYSPPLASPPQSPPQLDPLTLSPSNFNQYLDKRISPEDTTSETFHDFEIPGSLWTPGGPIYDEFSDTGTSLSSGPTLFPDSPGPSTLR